MAGFRRHASTDGLSTAAGGVSDADHLNQPDVVIQHALNEFTPREGSRDRYPRKEFTPREDERTRFGKDSGGETGEQHPGFPRSEGSHEGFKKNEYTPREMSKRSFNKKFDDESGAKHKKKEYTPQGEIRAKRVFKLKKKSDGDQQETLPDTTDHSDLQQKIDGPIAVEEFDVSQLPHEFLLRLETLKFFTTSSTCMWHLAF